MTPSRSRFSRARTASLCAVYVVMALHVVHGKLWGRTLAPVEFSEVLRTVHQGLITLGAVFMALALAGTLLFGRFFCGWACHVLALEDLCAWALGKLGLRAPPVRSRALLWAPFTLAFYLFAWPEIGRLWIGVPWPGLHVQSGTWGSFCTDDMWRNLPGPWISAITLLLCGFAIVWVLGSRSFCSTVCPYGALFRAADRAAPGRILLSGECTACGRCTAGCLSGVQVYHELRRFGAVVDPQCVRCLDCVGRCPERALRVGFATPPLLRGLPLPVRARLPASFSGAEEAALACLGLGAFLALRGLYDAIPVLLAAGVAVMAAYVWVLSLRLARPRAVTWRGAALRTPQGLTRKGRTLAAASLLLFVASAHCAAVRYQSARGDALFPAREALPHLERAYAWGLVHPLGLERRLASLQLRFGSPAAAEPHLRAILAAEPEDLGALVPLGRTLAGLRRRQEARRCLARAIELTRRGAATAPTRVLLGLGALSADLGKLPQAHEFLRRALDADPGSAVAAHDLALVDARLAGEASRR